MLRLQVHGEIDATNCVAFEAAFVRATSRRTRQLRLDLSRIKFVDAAGARTLIDCVLGAQERGHEVVIDGVSKPVGRILELLAGIPATADKLSRCGLRGAIAP